MAYLRLQDAETGATLEFDAPLVRIGRQPDLELVPSGAGSEVVSGNHAQFQEQDGVWWLEDLGSRNGTFVDDQRLDPGTPVRIAAGQAVRVGSRGPTYRVEAVAKRVIAETMVEAQPPVSALDATLPMDAYETGESPAPSPPPAPPRPEAPSPPPPPPPAPERPEISLVLTEVKLQERHEASGGRIRLGRGRECELRPVGPDDTSVSRVHAEIVLKPDGSVVLRDAQSRNGTFLNGAPVTGEQPLKRGDRIQLGPTGPDLSVTVLRRPGEEPAPAAAPPKAEKRPEPKGGRPASKASGLRRSFGGKGATMFFSEMFEETSRKAARRVRWIVWSVVVLMAGGVGTALWYKGQLERRLQSELETRLAVQQAVADSVRVAASDEYDRLRREFAEARAGSAPAAVVESLRVALNDAQARTSALEASLQRAQESLDEQLAAGDSIRRAAQADLRRLQAELDLASDGAATPGGLLDSLRAAVQAAEQRAAAVASQVDAVRGGNLAPIAQANGSAVGLVTAYIGADVYDGSGFALTASGYFVTNRHVLQPRGQRRADSVFVTMADQKVMRRAQVVRIADPNGPDLALLRILNHDGSHVPRVDWSGQHVHQGEPAALIGFPAGFGNAVDGTGAVRTSMSAGIFSKVTADVINFDGFTIGGSSGSPIFNADGEVVAIHRAGLQEAVGLGFAVPITQLPPLMPAELRLAVGLQ